MNNKVTVNIPKDNFDKAIENIIEQAAMKECEITIEITLKEAFEVG